MTVITFMNHSWLISMAWLPKTKKLICGHDYMKADYPGVQQALDEYFGPGQVQRGPGSLWYVDK